MGKPSSGGVAGAETTGLVFDGSGKLREATIILGARFAKNPPLNSAAYPVLSAFTTETNDISREARAIAFIAHEFGHVDHARRIGGALYQRENQLLSRNEAGFRQYGWDWFKRPEYRELVAELGAAPFDVMRRREIGAEATAIPVIQDYYLGVKLPKPVQQAIRNYKETYPLSVAVADTQRIFAAELDPELPKVSFADWFERVVGPGAGVIWQLSECGERRDNPVDIRACVEANAMLPDGRRVILMTAVGSFKQGVTGPPRFDFGVIDHQGNLYPVRRLRDLQKQLQRTTGLATRPVVKLPEMSIPKVWLSANNAHVDLAAVEGWDAFGHAIEDPPPAGPALSKATSDAESQDASEVPGRPAAAREVKFLGSVSWGDVIKKSQPRYPAPAKRVNAAGPVNVQITISETGRVIEAKATSGHPLLWNAAVEAARLWVFKPAILNGSPVKTETVLVFVFMVPE